VIDARPPQSRSAAVSFSSYAQPLLEGCGTIKKVTCESVGQTESVPLLPLFCSGPARPV